MTNPYAHPLVYRGATIAESDMAVRLYDRLNREEIIETFQTLGLKIFISLHKDENNDFTPRVQSMDEKGSIKWMIVMGDSWCGTYVRDEREMEKEVLFMIMAT